MSELPRCRLCEAEHHSPQLACVVDSFCLECDEYFCENCRKMHGKFPLLSAHCVIPFNDIATFPKELISQAVKCEVHPEHSKEYYCAKHCESFCFSCLIATHRCCKSDRINLISQDSRFSYRFTELQKQMEEELKSVQKAINNNLITTHDLATQKERIEVQLLAFKEEVNTSLKQLTHQINHLYKEESKKLDAEIHELSIIEKTLLNQQISLSQISKYCTEDNVFLCLHETEKLLKIEKEKVYSITTSLKPSSLEVTEINILDDLKCKLNQMKVCLTVKPVRFETSQRSPAQIILLPVTEKCDAITPWLKLKCHINLLEQGIKAPIINDCTVFQDGAIVVLEQRHKCILEFTQAGKLTRNVEIKNRLKPLCITATGKDLFAFTAENNDQVQIFGKNSLNSNATVSVRANCTGISTFSENQLIVGCSSAELVVMSTDGERQQVFNTTELLHIHTMFLTVSKSGQIFFSLPVKNTIVAIDLNGKLGFKFLNKKLQNPRGITLDSNNNILVAGYYSNNIIWISKDGKRFEEILTKKDG